MKQILTAQQMRQADQAAIDGGISGFALMRRAGRAVADAAQRVAPDTGRMVIVVGSGNNGGDGYAAATILSQMKVRVTVVALCDPAGLGGAAAEHAELAAAAGAKIRHACSAEQADVLSFWLTRAVLVIDAVFGTGMDRDLGGWLGEALDIVNASDRPVLSVDLPSGINSDTGAVMGAAIEADWTLPIAAVKWGHWLGEGRQHHGRLLAPADIGIEPEAASGSALMLDESLFRLLRPDEKLDMHKGSFGHVWVFGGSEGFSGAPRLAAMGAMAVHAGLVSIACPDDVHALIATASLEAMVHKQERAPWSHADAIIAGPGWGDGQQKMLAELLHSDRPLLLDADALNLLAGDALLQSAAGKRKALTVYTPHPGEASRMLGCTAAQVQQDRPAALRSLLETLRGWVVLKGEQTLIGSPDGSIWLCPFGSNRLATAGSGDVLGGMLAGLLAQGLPVELALAGGVALHARAGEEEGWYRAGQLPDKVAEVRRQLC